MKSELQNIATEFKKKNSLVKESRSLNNYETKSNNLGVLRDETLISLHSVVGKVDNAH